MQVKPRVKTLNIRVPQWCETHLKAMDLLPFAPRARVWQRCEVTVPSLFSDLGGLASTNHF